LLDADAAVAKRALDKIESLLPLLDRAGFARDMCVDTYFHAIDSWCRVSRGRYQDFYDPLQALLVSFASQRPTATTLLAAFNDAETSNSIVVFLRLLTSAYLRANEDDFTPFLFGLEDDPRFFEGGVPTLEMFCGFHVEVSLSFWKARPELTCNPPQAVDKEADHIQITALTRALKIHTRIAYLDQSDGETALHEFEEGSEDVLGCALLYRESSLQSRRSQC
jgi:ubiquitin thioesterase protein OTUB1